MSKPYFRRTLLPLLVAVIGTPLMSQPAAAPTLAALGSLESGQWQLRGQGNAGTQSMCLGDPRTLLQPVHARAACSRFVISNAPKAATVHYTCPGSGHGRTTVRVETSRLVQIESQGISNNEPFSVHFEGRRVGECAGVRQSAGR